MFAAKNKNFYVKQIQKLSNKYDISIHLLYGGELFNQIKKSEVEDEILRYLIKWKNSIADLPDINFDKNPSSFNEIKHVKPLIYKKLFANVDLDKLLCILFPTRQTLNLLNNDFKQMYQHSKREIYKTLSNLLTKQLIRMDEIQ